MIGLHKKIMESLLDDEEDILDRSDTSISQDILNDLSSDIYKDYNWGGIVRDSAKMIDDHTIKFPTSYRTLDIGGRNHRDFKSLKSYIPNVDTMEAEGDVRVYSEKSLSGDDICKNIKCRTIYMSMRGGKEISDFNLISNSGSYFKFSIDASFNPVILKNINIVNNTSNNNLIYVHSDHIPEFKNVNVSKNTKLNIYSVFMAFNNDKGINKEINDLFDQTYKANVYDYKKKEKVLRKTDIKTIQATLSNPKRYRLETNLFKLKEGIKMTNFIKGLPHNIDDVVIENNKITLRFRKASNDIPKNVKTCGFTDDGWRLEIY